MSETESTPIKKTRNLAGAGGGKGQAIREYMDAHPEASRKQVAAACECTVGRVGEVVRAFVMDPEGKPADPSTKPEWKRGRKAAAEVVEPSKAVYTLVMSNPADATPAQFAAATAYAKARRVKKPQLAA
jgi:hypothetical protein